MTFLKRIMSKRNEDNIERFFKKALSQYDTSFRENDWKDMEKMLDDRAIEKAAASGKRFKLISAAIIALLLISSSVYFAAINSQEEPVKSSGIDLPEQKQAAAGAEAPGSEGEIKSPSADLLSSTTSTTENQAGDKKAIAPVIEQKGNRNPADAVRSSGTHTSLSTKGTAKIINGSPKQADGTKLSATEQALESNVDEEIERSRSNVENSSYIKNDRPIGNEAGVMEKSVLTPIRQNESELSKDVRDVALPADQKKETVAENEELKKEAVADKPASLLAASQNNLMPVPTRWSVALTVAPDFSSTGLGNYTAPGKAFGFLTYYQPHTRLTLATGLIRSTKKYASYGEDYQPPDGYWQRRTNGIVPDEITGTCEMLEIPLMVQYSALLREKSRLYLSAGLSSYVMMSELYKYEFHEPNPGAARGWSTDKSSTYLFKVGHVSMGYERQLSQRIVLGIEPFLKVPLCGMGWSNIDIYSAGMFFNLRYRIFKKEAVVAGDEMFKTTK
jgi:hypothetical protein